MSESSEKPWTVQTVPWVTAVGVMIAVVVYNVPAWRDALGYDRLRVTQNGEWWRVLTGSYVHFSGRELVWNLAVLLPAGVWAERIAPLRARLVWLVAPLVVGGVVQAFLPDVLHFAGLSGTAAAMVAFLALAQLRTETPDRWFWRGVLILLAIKIGAEAVLASRLMSAVPDPMRRAEALIHLAGLCAGSVILRLKRRRK